MNVSFYYYEQVPDMVVLEGQYHSKARITLGQQKEGGPYAVRLEFSPLDGEEFRQLSRLSREDRALAICSERIQQRRHPLTHLLIRDCIIKSGPLSITWEGVAWDPAVHEC